MPKDEPASFRVIHPGLFTTVQDLGRVGYQRFGMPVSGAMDTTALRLANRLVGNPDDAAGLEITIKGPELLFETDALIALTGADLSPSINGLSIPLWTAMKIARGSTLSFGRRRSGARTYLALSGGVDVPVVLGSRSTHVRSHTGGFAGRALAKGDRLFGGRPPAEWLRLAERMIPLSARPSYSPNPILRIILGPQADYFSDKAFEAIASGCYTVSPQSDRMGYRLTGPPLPHAKAADIVSDATPLGALQVPANQQPILLMADHQTTGGYPKIGVVISTDLPLAAQLMPGDTLTFSIIDVAEAEAIARKESARIEAATCD